MACGTERQTLKFNDGSEHPIDAPAAGQVLTVDAGTGHIVGSAPGSFPVGSIIMYGGMAPPAGWFLCDGTSKNAVTYAALFAVIALTYGNTGGPGTFDVPNLLNRFPQGQGGSNAIGSSGGAVSPAVLDPGHQHAIAPLMVARVGGGLATATPPAATNAGATGITIPDGRPPFQTVNFIIKY